MSNPETTKVYRVKDWDLYFENNKSRERARCSFCCIPNKQDGLGYGRLIKMPDGPAMYAAFVAVLLIASKQKAPRKGWLTDDGLPAGCPLSARDVSTKCQIEENLIQKMLDTVSGVNIGWIECFEKAPDGQLSARRVPAECPPSALERKKERKKEGMERASVLDLIQNELKTIYGRVAETYAEQSQLAEVSRRPEAMAELELILAYRRRLPANEKRFFPNSVRSLLEKWTDTLDKAHVSQPATLRTQQPPKPKGQPMSIEKRRELWEKAKQTT